MTFLLVLLMLTACAATPQDLSGKMFVFPQQTNKAHVKLLAPQEDLNTLTICHRSFTDLKRDHSLFSLATPSRSNDFLIFWDEANKELECHIKDVKSEFPGLDYKLNMWHSICTTWDSATGMTQMWFDGRPSIKKFTSTGSSIGGNRIIILGQEQDAHGAGFDLKQSFVGMMSDVHMWDYILSPCQIQMYTDEQHFTPGNVLNWSALDSQIVDRVIEEDKTVICH